MGDTSFGLELRRRRTAEGLSLRQLSELAHVDFTYLSRAENGHRQPTELLAAAVDIALEADGELIAIAQAQRVVAASVAVTFDPVRRRDFVTTGIAATVASLSGAHDSTKRVGRVGLADVEPLDRAVARLRALGHQHGGASLWQAATGVAREGYYLLEQGTYTDDVEALLLAAIGRAQMCAGWLAFDSGNHEAARSCYNEALSLARQTADPSIEVHALVNLAFQSTFLGMPRQSIRYAEAAERIAFGKMAIVPQIRRATAYASFGEPAESRKAMARARTLLNKASDDEHGYWCAFVSPEELDGIEGTAAMRLGDLRRAETLLALAVSAHGDAFARNRALYRSRLAKTRLDLGEIDEAAETANQALDDLRGEVVSYVVNTELASLAKGLTGHPNRPAVEQFISRYGAQR